MRCLTSAIVIFVVIMATACTNLNQKENNPPASGFNAESSDEKAIKIADKVMEAMGGRLNWDNTRFIAWNFFDARELLWDKHTGKVRIEIPEDSTIYNIDIQSETCEAYINGEAITKKDTLQKLMHEAKGIWINDSYWLVMPFKLKDSGVTLKYQGLTEINNNIPAHVLELNFDEVGYTPENKYKVYVDTTDYLVKQWAYFKSAEQDSASAIWPWDNYKKYGDILLSANRSDGKGPKDVSVYDKMPDSVFTTSEFVLSEK